MTHATDQAAALVAQAHATARALADLLNAADAMHRATLADGASRDAVAHAARAYAFAEAAASAARAATYAAHNAAVELTKETRP